MKTGLLALALALLLVPISAAAQTPPQGGPPAMSDQQRQEMFNAFKTFHAQEETLHKQLRTQILAALTPLHRQTVATLIGNLAISANPDRDAVEKQFDALLSGAEKTQILNAHNNYLNQSKTLHQQAMQQMQKYMPAGAQEYGMHHDSMKSKNHMPVNDPGEILMRVLTGDDMHRMHPVMMPLGPPAMPH